MSTVETTRRRVEPTALVAAATAGDGAAFTELAEPYRRELQVHCYRMLGSFEESEDLVQETFLRAWRKRRTFRGSSTFRAWLYGIATNACLDAIGRRPHRLESGGRAQPLAEISWLQPFPDRLLEEIAPAGDEPEAKVVARETIELAYIAAIQVLPPRQRAVLIARDVLGWSAAECAAQLDITVAAVNSALQRARATMKQHLPRRRLEWAPGSDPTQAERTLLERYMEATERVDAAALVALLREDALFAMPPVPQTWIGGETIVEAWVEGGLGSETCRDLRCLYVRANRQPAVACYLRQPGEAAHSAFTLDVLRIEDGAIAEVIAFPLEPLLAAFDLPPTL
jgi:RNA polymerase sigma-70 factor (ECF subfamily)